MCFLCRRTQDHGVGDVTRQRLIVMLPSAIASFDNSRLERLCLVVTVSVDGLVSASPAFYPDCNIVVNVTVLTK